MLVCVGGVCIVVFSLTIFLSYFCLIEPIDMFADTVTSTESAAVAPPLSLSEVQWEYKWAREEGAEVHGPFSSTQMAQWVESG